LPLSPTLDDPTAAIAVAERIRDLAFAHGMAIRRDADLNECLTAIRAGDHIPVAAFAVVAEVLFTVLATNHPPAVSETES
jgi:flagellar biosynthesis protein